MQYLSPTVPEWASEDIQKITGFFFFFKQASYMGLYILFGKIYEK